MFNLLLLIGIAIWVYILSVFKRGGLIAFYFLLGSFGLFIIFSFLTKMYFVWLLGRIIAEGLDYLSNLIPGYLIHVSNNMVLINGIKGTYIPISYEYSGAIEIFAFESLLIFFPIYTNIEKVIIGVSGGFGILLANIIRLLLIIIVIRIFGSRYFIIGSIISRLLLYIVMVILYYYVFTKPQIIRGWTENLMKEK